MASVASVAARVSPRCSALARRSSRLASAVRICSTVPWARASASGLDRRHCASSALRTASSIRRRPCSRRSCASRGTDPACSQRSWMERSAARAARTLVTGTSWPASSSSADFTAACSRSSFSLAENTLDRSAKN